MFGQFLIEKDFASLDQVNEAIQLQKYTKKKLGRLMVELGYLTQEKLNQALHLYFMPINTESANNLKKRIDSLTGEGSLKSLAKTHKAILLSVEADRVEFIATFLDDNMLEEAESLASRAALVRIVTQEILDFLKQPESEGHGSTSHGLTVSQNQTDDQKLSEDTPYARLFKECLETAKNRGASDIHIEPSESGVDIRLRENGSLVLWKTLDREHRDPLISKVKWLLNMDLAIVGRPQDSRASFNQFRVDIRANSLPILNGEKIVLRLLNQEQNFNLASSGLEADTLADIRRVIKKRDGLILISGPTGSGKTTTLYSLLCEIDRGRKNVSTLENPVEYQLTGINQVNISSEGDLTFSDSLRALMRQDPDVILVGEIRDKETAELCFKAAATGHLVLSTVHANGAREVVERLTNLGVDPFTIRSNLRFSAAQRLVRRICPNCSLEVEPPIAKEIQHQFSELTKDDFKNFRVTNPDGCDKCSSGVVGRKAVLEYMRSDEVQSFLSEPMKNQNSLAVSLKEAAVALAKRAEIDASELLEIA